MPALSKADVEFRLALYTRYNEALARFEGVNATMPEAPPEGLVVTWGERFGAYTDAELAEEETFAPRRRTKSVVSRTWGALRKAVLADSEKELAEAEEAVLAFERGDEVGKSE